MYMQKEDHSALPDLLMELSSLSRTQLSWSKSTSNAGGNSNEHELEGSHGRFLIPLPRQQKCNRNVGGDFRAGSCSPSRYLANSTKTEIDHVRVSTTPRTPLGSTLHYIFILKILLPLANRTENPALIGFSQIQSPCSIGGFQRLIFS